MRGQDMFSSQELGDYDTRYLRKKHAQKLQPEMYALQDVQEEEFEEDYQDEEEDFTEEDFQEPDYQLSDEVFFSHLPYRKPKHKDDPGSDPFPVYKRQAKRYEDFDQGDYAKRTVALHEPDYNNNITFRMRVQQVIVNILAFLAVLVFGFALGVVCAFIYISSLRVP